MARFFLHVHNSIGFVRDEEGQDLPDLAAAKDAAVAGIRSIVGEEAQRGVIDLAGRIEIADEGAVVATVPFRDAFTLTLDGAA